MFSSMFWPRRKNIANKSNDKTKIPTVVDEECSSDKYKEKKFKKLEKSSSIFKKLRKSFVKAKSMDSSDVSLKRNSQLQNKHSSDNLETKSSAMSLRRRIFSSTKQRKVSVPIATTKSTTPPNSDFRKSSASPILRTTASISTAAVKPVVVAAVKGQLVGIVNHGNTCYINSIIQCLNTIDVLVKYFVLDQYKNNPMVATTATTTETIKPKDSAALLCSFTSLLKSLWQRDLNCDILANEFKQSLAVTEKSFRCNDQQDAQEFLLFLLNYFHETLKTAPLQGSEGLLRSPKTVLASGPVKRLDSRLMGKSREPKYDLSSEADKIWTLNRSIVHQLFVTHQQLTITCPGCLSRQYKLEPHLCLSLPVPAKTMEPLYYCFIEKDGSQICAAMWVNTVSLVQYVRSNIAHKFRIDVNRVIIMLITESGFGKCFQDSEEAVDLLSPDNGHQTMSNLWNGIVALEIPSALSNSLESQSHQKSIRQMKNSNSPIHRTNSSNANGANRYSGIYDNLKFEEHNDYESQNTRLDNNSQTNNIRIQDDQYQQSNQTYPDNFSNDTSHTVGAPINLVIIHVEEIIEKAYVSGWRRFSAPVSLLVCKEIEFNELEKIVIEQLESVYHCNIQSKLKSNLRFFVWDCLNNIDAEITSDHQFPLLTEAVESIISWSENSSIIRMVGVWSPSNAARLMQTVFANLRLSHSLGREVSKIEMANDRNGTSQSLALMDAWSSIEENGSVELVMRATLSKRSQASDSRIVSLEDCLKAYVSEEVLDAKDAWKCPHCRKFQRATISNSIYSLPDILVLHLKRFQSYSLTFNCADGKSGRDPEDVAMATVGGNNTHSHSGSLLCENNSNNKLNILVDYPLSGLDMKSYLSSDAIKNSSKKIDPNDYYYDLIAVCNHQGTLSTGHYTAFCRSSVDYKWRLFNDDVVREVLTDKVIQANAYILFYQRRSSIVSLDQHWSIILNPSQSDDCVKDSSPHSYKTPNLDNRKPLYDNKSSTNIKPLLRKSDPPIRRLPPSYQNKNISNLKTAAATTKATSVHSNVKLIQQQSSLHRPLPLDNNCNSLRNNTPIIDDNDDDGDDDDDDDDDATSQGSTSYDEYIPVSVTKRPLVLPIKSKEVVQCALLSPKSH